MTDYSQGKVYLIYIPGLEEYGYVGSTVVPLNDRLRIHRHTAKSECKYKFASCVLFGEDNEVCIKLLEAWPCETKQELLEREKYWLTQYPEAVNKNPPILTEEERKAHQKFFTARAYEKNKDHNLQKHREWLEAHKEQESEKQKARREADLEAARAKDKRNNATRDKEKRKEWKNAKVTCGACGLVLSRNNFSTHKKNKHEGQEVEYILI